MASDTYGAILLTTANDVGAMLQKKMATPSETYAPAVWAKTINLLGKLPEATVSGSIVTFSDGADDVPLKSCEVALSPSLDGYSSVTVHHTDGQTPPVFSEDYTALLGRTIYGGTADVVNGTGTEQYQKVKVSDLTWIKQTASGRDFFIATISDQEISNTHDVAIDITGLTYAGMVTVSAMSDKSLAKWLQSVRIYDTSISSVSDLLSAYGNGEIVFYLKDMLQTDFTFTGQEINTRLGNNTFWSEQGDTEVTYRRDIDLALQALSGSRGLMMARPPAAAETEETEPEDETTETIEETPEDMEK